MRQFGFDQAVPFTPLVSLHTREDIGIAYAYWEHLLRPEQQKKTMWFPWLPTRQILNMVGCLVENIYTIICSSFANSPLWLCSWSGALWAHEEVCSRGSYPLHTVYHDDLFLVREVPVERQDSQRIAAREAECKAILMSLLRVYLDETTHQASLYR
jgi:hypothetical protein